MLLLAFLLPSSAIAYLSVQSVRKEAVARKHLVLQTFGSIGHLVTEEIDRRIEALDSQILQELAKTESGQLSDRIKGLEDSHPHVRPLIFLDGDWERDSSQDVGPGTGFTTSLSPQFKVLFQRAETAELKDEQITAAESLYSRAYGEAQTTYERVLALNGKARCLIKLRQHSQALQTYQLLVESATPLTPEVVNRVLSARFQITQCLIALGDRDGLRKATLALLQCLIRHAFELGPDPYHFYSSKLGTVLEIAWGAHPSEEIETLLSQGSRLRAAFNILEQAKEAARRVVIDTVEERDDGSIEYVSLPFESKAFAAVLQFDSKGEPGIGVRCVVLHLWTIEDLIVLAQDLLKEPGPWSEAGVSVLSENGEVLFSTSDVDSTPEGVVASRLPAMPHLEIVAFPLSGSPDAIVSNEIRTYSVLIILVVLAVVGGLYLTVRSISRELSLARLRSDFVAGVSHEFKTPISLIRLHVENLRSGWVKDEKRQEYYEVITREAERLSGLVDNALSLARIEAGTEHYDRKPIDFSGLVDKTFDGFRPHLEDKRISLSLSLPDDPVPVEGDSEALERMLINLLSNAAKYMRDEERRIEVAVARERKHARLDIEDTGIGISEEDLGKLFDKFFRVQGQPGKPVGGSGVGLTLVKHIVDSHDGQISVESEPGKGSKFSVRLPLMDARAGI